MPKPFTPLAERFWSRVEREPECWTWTGAKNQLGYGLIGAGGRGGRNLKAHRVAWELEHGPIPEGLEVRHLCNNPSCVNPAHLEPGTHAANQADIAKGMKHGRRKLTTEQVREIRTAWEAGERSPRLSIRYDVTKRTIMQLIRRVNYRYD